MEQRKIVITGLGVVSPNGISDSKRDMSHIYISTKVMAKPDEVYALLKDSQRIRKLVPQLRRVEILTKYSRNRRVSEWEADVESTRFQWKQEDSFEDERLLWLFYMAEGDCASFQGKCTVIPLGQVCRISIEITFDWGIPYLGQYVGRVLEKKVKRNLIRMIAILRKEASLGIP